MKSITAAEYHKDRPLSDLAQMAELFARMSLDMETYDEPSRLRLAAVVDRIRLRMLARLRPSFNATAAW